LSKDTAAILGQERAVALLERSLAGGQLAHAYLFSGPPHVGKMTLALWLARVLQCSAAQPPCDECDSCRKVNEGKHADVRVISLLGGEDGGESTRTRTAITVEQIEQIQHEASLPPLEGRYRIFIVEGAEQLSGGAANRLLKTLEEPEPGVIFLLLTDRESGLPATVTSRCQRVELMPVLPEPLEKWLLGHRQEISPETARLVSRLAKGCPGWAMRALLDEGILKEYAGEVTRIVDTIKADYEGRLAYASEMATRFGHDRESVYDRLCIWLDLWRDMLLIKAGCPEAIANLETEAELTQLAASFSLSQLRAGLAGIEDVRSQLRRNINPRLALDVFLLDLPGK